MTDASTTADRLREALAMHRRGSIAEAAVLYESVLRSDPDNRDASYYLGLIACQDGRFADGAALARRSLAGDPQNVRAQILLGRALNGLNRHEEALASFEQAIAAAPDLAQPHGLRGDVLSELGRNAEAIESYDRALALNPDAAEEWFNRGVALAAVGRNEEAVASFDRALAAKPEFTPIRLRRAKALADLGRYTEAIEDIDKTLGAQPQLAEAWFGRGDILQRLKRREDALAAYDRALALKPGLFEAWLGRGNIHTELKQFDAALAAYDKVLEARPGLAEGWLGRGNTFLTLKRYEDAIAAYAQAPDLADAWLGRGNALVELKRYDDALAAYDQASALNPGLAAVWLGRGAVLAKLKRSDAAVAALDKAVALDPHLDFAASLHLITKLQNCDWTDVETEIAALLESVRASANLNIPFVILATAPLPADQLQCASDYVGAQPAFAPLWRDEVYAHDRVRIAYLSADFHDHATSQLLAGMFERHDRSRFEVTAISYGPDKPSKMRQRVQQAFDRFVDVRDQSDHGVAALIRRLEIDIAIDLKGFTAEGRDGIVARRPAPIQVNYMGFPGTLGAPYIDYIVADSTVIPEDECRFYREQVIWLPDSYYVNDSKREISARVFTRRDCELPADAFVFCCFNNTYKILPQTFDVWARLLKAVDNSVLWLIKDSDGAAENLRRAAAARGVAPERLIFAPRMSSPAHLARHRLADLLLDTLPYNAHTTACDALWVGVPVVTLPGTTFVGRVAASLLKAIGLDTLIAHSAEEYEALVLKLAREPSRLKAIKDTLLRNRDTFPLFDTARFTRHMEAAYALMWERRQRGEPARPRSGAARPIRIAPLEPVGTGRAI